MATVRIIDPAKEDRRQRTTIITLLSVGILGISFLVYDYTRIVNYLPIPENFSEIDPIVRQWENEGLVFSFDSNKGLLIVEEDKWNEHDRDNKAKIITQLARYCARKNNWPSWTLKVMGRQSKAIIGEMGPNGLMVQ